MNEPNEKLDFKNSNTFAHSIDNLSNSKKDNNGNIDIESNEIENANCQSYETEDEYLEKSTNEKSESKEQPKWISESYNQQVYHDEEDINNESDLELSNVKISELNKNKSESLLKVDISAEEDYDDYLNEEEYNEENFSNEEPSLYENNDDENKQLPLNASQAIYLQAK